MSKIYWLGIDIGSTTVKVVLVDPVTKEILYRDYVRHGAKQRSVARDLLKDIVAKSMGTSNAHNVIRATMKALSKQNSPKQISAIRNKKISEIVEKRG